MGDTESEVFRIIGEGKLGDTKVNWSSAPRLLIIAKSFDIKELSAINMISASVELKKYSFYGNLISVEDVTPPKKARTFKGEEPPTVEVKERTIEGVVKTASPELKNLFFKLRNGILELGEDVREKVGGWYIDYRKTSTFASVNPKPKKNRLLIYIKMGDKKILDPQSWTKPVPKSFSYGKINTQFEISELGQLKYAMDLIRQAYDYVP